VEIEERISGDVAILDLRGRLVQDDDGEGLFRQKVDDLIQRGRKNILLNLNDVTDLDSTGVGAVVWKYVTLKRQGGTLKLVGLTPRSRRILATAKLLTVLAAFDAEAEAVKSFQ